MIEHLLRLEGKKDLHITESAVTLLEKHDFQGNVRELRNIISRSVVICETNLIDEAVIKRSLAFDDAAENSLIGPNTNISLKEIEAQYLRDLLVQYKNDKKQIAKVADISLRTLYRKLEQYELSTKTN